MKGSSPRTAPIAENGPLKVTRLEEQETLDMWCRCIIQLIGRCQCLQTVAYDKIVALGSAQPCVNGNDRSKVVGFR